MTLIVNLVDVRSPEKGSTISGNFVSVLKMTEEVKIK
jgi:hypothetical protein